MITSNYLGEQRGDAPVPGQFRRHTPMDPGTANRSDDMESPSIKDKCFSREFQQMPGTNRDPTSAPPAAASCFRS